MPVSDQAVTGAGAFLTARDAADQLGVHERTIRRAIARGELRALKQSGAFRIAWVDLEQFRRWRVRTPVVSASYPAAGADQSELPGPPRFPPGQGALPAPLTSLVGRATEVAALAAALRGPERLVTLTGPGGIGKTRLAVAAAHKVAGDFAQGVCYVSLAAMTDPALVAPEIADALGVPVAGEGEVVERLAATLRDRRLLLVLDNFEPVLAAAPLVATLLAAAPALTVLATSRIRLRLTGEQERVVQPLPTRLPAGAGDLVPDPDPTAVRDAPAVQLFFARARAVRQDIAEDPEGVAVAAAICRQLDGLPLAIELAAARVNALSLPALLGHLERPLTLLTDGPRDAPPRQRTMRDAIAWSCDLLAEDERRLFRRLATFAGGFTLDAAEGVCGDGESVFSGLVSLVESSLVTAQTTVTGDTRYSLLETIREFGLEQLAADGEWAQVARRHADWYLAFAADAGPRTRQRDAAAWLPRLQAEHLNLLAALEWFQAARDGECLLRLTGSLWPFWQEQNHCAEGLRWLERALDLGRAAPAVDRLLALAGAGTLAWYLTRVPQARAWHDEALALARAAGDAAAEAQALSDRSWLLAEDGDLAAAVAACAASITLARAAGAMPILAQALHNLACFARMQGELTAARQHAAEALALARAEGWQWLVTMILVGYGYTALALGDLEQAVVLHREALDLGVARGDLVDVTSALEGLASSAVAAAQREQAVRLFGASAALRDAMAMPMSPTEHAYFQPLLETLRAELGAERFASGWAAGHDQPRASAIAEARRFRVSTAAAVSPRLTLRERDVLQQLATGKSTRAIGESLFISPTTVATHIASLYRKLGVRSRVEAVAWAHRHGAG